MTIIATRSERFNLFGKPAVLHGSHTNPMSSTSDVLGDMAVSAVSAEISQLLSAAVMGRTAATPDYVSERIGCEVIVRALPAQTTADEVGAAMAARYGEVDSVDRSAEEDFAFVTFSCRTAARAAIDGGEVSLGGDAPPLAVVPAPPLLLCAPPPPNPFLPLMRSSRVPDRRAVLRLVDELLARPLPPAEPLLPLAPFQGAGAASVAAPPAGEAAGGGRG